MLSERKRFNYMANTGHYNSSQSNRKAYVSTVKPSTTVFQEENLQPISQIKYREEKENKIRNDLNAKKVQELEEMNKKLVDETARQFKKLEEDVQRVENILEEKQRALDEHKSDNYRLKDEVNKVSDQKKILIEAIFEKDIVIKEFEAKFREMIEEQAYKAATPMKEIVVQSEQNAIQSEETSMQTEVQPETCPKSEMVELQMHNLQLQDQSYRLKQELFDATNKVKLLTQQFQAYKILKQIETIQQS